MRTRCLATCLGLFALPAHLPFAGAVNPPETASSATLFAQARSDAAEPIDMNKARGYFQRRQRGEKLTPEEDAYLKRALELRAKGGGGRATNPKQRKAAGRLVPLTDMAATDRYEGQDGGLYGGGRNAPADAQRKAAEGELAKVRPLNAEGEPDAGGTIGFVSISMSNATQEFSRFKQIADQSPLKSGRVTIVDCAQGGQAMAQWVPVNGRPWQVAHERLAKAGVSPGQVQIAWVKLANVGPSGSLEEHGRKLERDTLAVLHNARAAFPNLRVAYLGSRIYAGYATTGLNPEPYAYESAFVVRWLIDRQARGDVGLALAKSPLLLWGPYLWAEGERGRQVDQLVWKREDLAGDGTHPSTSGRQKVADLMLNFFTTDPLAKPWFGR